MRFDDAAGDVQAQARMKAERLARRALAVEAVENRRELARRKPRTVVFHRNAHAVRIRRQPYADRAVRRAERNRIVDEVSENLAQAVLDRRHGNGAGRLGFEEDLRPGLIGFGVEFGALDRD